MERKEEEKSIYHQASHSRITKGSLLASRGFNINAVLTNID